MRCGVRAETLRGRPRATGAGDTSTKKQSARLIASGCADRTLFRRCGWRLLFLHDDRRPKTICEAASSALGRGAERRYLQVCSTVVSTTDTLGVYKTESVREITFFSCLAGQCQGRIVPLLPGCVRKWGRLGQHRSTPRGRQARNTFIPPHTPTPASTPHISSSAVTHLLSPTFLSVRRACGFISTGTAQEMRGIHSSIGVQILCQNDMSSSPNSPLTFACMYRRSGPGRLS